jgi:hypothetical protein
VASGSGQVSGPWVRHCRFLDNQSANGGGIGVLGQLGATASPNIRHCTFTGNTGKTMGGGIYLLAQRAGSVTATVDSCVFSNNSAYDPGTIQARGGAIAAYVFGAGSSLTATVDHCEFTNNTAEQWGGAIWSYTRQGTSCTMNVSQSQFVGNQSNSGGAVHNHAQGGNCQTTLSACVFSNNAASFSGGAIRNYCELNGGNGTVDVQDCLFEGNLSGYSGGAVSNVSLKGGVAVASLSRCRFEANEAAQRGGAFYEQASQRSANFPATASSAELENCVFHANQSGSRGGVVYTEGVYAAPADLSVLHGTFATNTSAMGSALFNNTATAGLSTVSLGNSVFWNHTATSPNGRLFHGIGGAASIELRHNSLPNEILADNCAGTGTLTNGGGNLAGDPYFVNLALGDLHLQAFSPCVDAGAAVPTALDFDGNVRPQGNGFDIGAYEVAGARPVHRQVLAETETSVPEMAVFPNPNTGVFTVSLDRPCDGVAQVFDACGRLVTQQALYGQAQAVFEVSGETSGILFVRVATAEFTLLRTVVIGQE